MSIAGGELNCCGSEAHFAARAGRPAAWSLRRPPGDGNRQHLPTRPGSLARLGGPKYR